MFKGLVDRVVGTPPEAGAPRPEQLRWVRKLYRFNLGAIALLVLFALTGGQSLLWILAAAITLLWVIGLASISFSIRRAESADAGPR